MSDVQNDRPGEPGTTEGEAGPKEPDPAAPSVEGRDIDETADEHIPRPSALIRLVRAPVAVSPPTPPRSQPG